MDKEQSNFISSKFLLLLAVAFYAILFFISKELPFFWDTVLFGSSVPHDFLENGFGDFIPYDSINSGHPTLFSVLITLGWKILGKHLWVGHFFTFLFSIALAYQWIQLCKFLLPERLWIFGLIFLLIEPTLLAQSVLVSPEIPLLLGLFWALNCILRGEHFQLIFPLCLLALISTRGSIWLFILFLFHVSARDQAGKYLSYRVIPYYLLPVGLVLAWLFYHFQQTGWIAQNPNGNWADTHAYAGFFEFFKNWGLLLLRHLEFNRIFVVLACIFSAFQYRRYFQDWSKGQKDLWRLLFIGVLILGFITTIKTNQTLPRYYIFFYLLIGMNMLQFFVVYEDFKYRRILFTIISAALILAHGYIYPSHVDQGWDASLAFIPALEQKEAIERALAANNISKGDVISSFPFRHSRKISHLEIDNQRYASYDDHTELDKPYLLWSNVINNYPDNLLEEIEESHDLIFKNCMRQVCVCIYQKKRPVQWW